MRKKIITASLISAAAIQCFAANTKPAYKWFAARDFSLIIPVNQKFSIDSYKDESPSAFGLSLMGIGNETISKTGGLRIQSIRIDSPVTGKNTFYLFEFLFGVKYTKSLEQGQNLRPVFAVLGNLGMASSGDFFLMPEITAGFLYSNDLMAETPKGFIFELFYKPFETDISDAGNNKKGTLKPSLGLKIGYIFEGFWQLKQEKH